MSSKRLTLDLILSTIDKASAPLKKVALSTDGAAKSLKAARETSKRLNDQLGDVRKYRSTRAQLRLNGAQTKKYTNQLEEANSEVKTQYAAHDRIKGTLRAAEKRYKLLVKQFEDGTGSSQEFRYELDKARMKVDTMTRAVSESNSKLRQYRGKAGHAKTMLKQLPGSTRTPLKHYTSIERSWTAQGSAPISWQPKTASYNAPLMAPMMS